MSPLIPVLSRTPGLLKELTRLLPNLTFHEVQNPETDPHLKTAEILISDFDLLGPLAYNLPNMKWVSGTWAGVDKLTPFIKSPINYQITRFTGAHFGRIMSEYVLANIVNHERGFYDMKSASKWNRSGKITKYRIISDLTVGVLGVGSIGNRIGQSLAFLGATVLALGRRSTLPNDGDFGYVSGYYTKGNLQDLLAKADYIINVLPKTNETDGLLDGGILEHCKERQSVLINIGRSNILSEASIIDALTQKWLSAVILDVFDNEPLPPDNVLWKMEKVFITPHVAGMTRAKDVAEQFKSNFEIYQKKLPLPAVIDFTRGY